MPSPILSPDIIAGPSTDIVVAANTTVKVGLYVTAGDVPRNADFKIYEKTPGLPNLIGPLGRESTILTGPGTYYVQRILSGTALGHATPQIPVGVFLDI